MHPSNFKMTSQENITSLTSFPPGKDTFFITYLDIISCDNGWYEDQSIKAQENFTIFDQNLA